MHLNVPGQGTFLLFTYVHTQTSKLEGFLSPLERGYHAQGIHSKEILKTKSRFNRNCTETGYHKREAHLSQGNSTQLPSALTEIDLEKSILTNHLLEHLSQNSLPHVANITIWEVVL